MGDEAYRILGSKKSENSRTLRRFLENYMDISSGVMEIEIVNGEGYSDSQFAHIRKHAEKELPVFREKIEIYGDLDIKVSMSVKNKQLTWILEFSDKPAESKISLYALRQRMWILYYINQFLAPLAINMSGTVGFVDYHYRHLPCSIASDEKLWCISGIDLRNSSSGVLEWCYDEHDAQSTLANMQKFKSRFANICANRFLPE